MSVKILILAVCLFVGVFGEITRYNGYSVYRLVPKTMEQLEYLHDLSLTTTELDFWTYPTGLNETVDIMLSPEQKERYGAMFRALKIEQSTMIKDVEELEELRRSEVLRNYSTPFTREVFPGFWTQYRRLADFFTFLDAARAAVPAISAVETIGRSYENREIRLIKLGIGYSTNTKPIVFIDSLIHAREWITGASVSYYVQYLVDGYLNNNAAVIALLTKYDFYILPVVNPDGYEFTHTSTRLWRKTRAPNSGSTCIGTDANRNWNNNWNLNGASQNPCSETYSGTGASSTPEVRALSDYLLSLVPRVKVYFPVHSYSQLLLYSYGYSSALPPTNAALLARGQQATAALTAVNGVSYRVGTITNVLYAASGSAVDFGYENCQIPYVYTIELRDTGTYGFQLPVSLIAPSNAENTVFFTTFAQSVASEF
jgi:murein tripeptide amidase MpaA